MSNLKRGPDTHHVVPHRGGGWDVRRGGAERASGHFPTKSQAVDSGRESAAMPAPTPQRQRLRRRTYGHGDNLHP